MNLSKTFKLFAVVPINQIEIGERTGRGIKLSDSLLLSNEPSYISDFLIPELKEYIGLADFNSLKSDNSVFAFASKNIELHSNDHKSVIAQLNIVLVQVVKFLHYLWIVRDNAAYPDCGFLILSQGGKAVRTAKNYLGHHYSMAQGGRDQRVAFSLAELRLVRDFSGGVLNQVETASTQTAGYSELHSLVPNSPDSSRVIRCLHALEGARVANYYPEKIAMYITAMETLFSTSSSELTYRLSERVAFILGESQAEREQLFDTVKAAYTVRSSVVHGDTVDKKYRTVEKLKDLTVGCDEILRKSLFKILTSEDLSVLFGSGSKDEIDKYFSSLIFRFPIACGEDSGTSANSPAPAHPPGCHS